MGSGSLSLPSRGAFHRSLTVLVRYRLLVVFSLGWWSTQLQSGFRGSRPTWEPVPRPPPRDAYGAFARSGAAFQPTSACKVADVGSRAPSLRWSRNPSCATPPGLTRRTFRLLPVRSPLLGECFLFLVVLRCFSSHGAPPAPDGTGCQGMTPSRLPHSETPGSPRARPLPGAFRRLAASFLGHQHQGIHHPPFLPHLARKASSASRHAHRRGHDASSYTPCSDLRLERCRPSSGPAG